MPTDRILNFRMITHITSAQSLEIGDVEGHVASLVRFSGVVLLPDDTVGTVHFVTVTDYTCGTGDFILYPILTFPDESVLWLKSVGTGTLEGSKTRFIGTTSVVGGKGRFEGMKGSGSVTGTRYTQLSVGADLVSDYSIRFEM